MKLSTDLHSGKNRLAMIACLKLLQLLQLLQDHTFTLYESDRISNEFTFSKLFLELQHKLSHKLPLSVKVKKVSPKSKS